VNIQNRKALLLFVSRAFYRVVFNCHQLAELLKRLTEKLITKSVKESAERLGVCTLCFVVRA
jgi:hypothetical protein